MEETNVEGAEVDHHNILIPELTWLKELRKRKGGQFLENQNATLFLHWSWVTDLESYKFSMTIDSPGRDSWVCGVSALMIGVQPCMGHTQNVLWLPWALGVWVCPSLSCTLEALMLDCSCLSPEWHGPCLSPSPYTWHRLLWCSSFASLQRLFMQMACWLRLGTQSSQEQMVPGTLLSMDMDEIIVLRAAK